MLNASRKGFWKNDYELSVDGRPLTRWNARSWRSGGSFTLAGRRYDVASNVLGSRFTMTDETGMLFATASRVGRKRWSIEAQGRTYAFERASFWRSEERLVESGQTVGTVRRTSNWSGDAEADLPGLPLPLQVFAFTTILTGWDQTAAAAAS
jgi:hypothetical protein